MFIKNVAQRKAHVQPLLVICRIFMKLFPEEHHPLVLNLTGNIINGFCAV